MGGLVTSIVTHSLRVLETILVNHSRESIGYLCSDALTLQYWIAAIYSDALSHIYNLSGYPRRDKPFKFSNSRHAAYPPKSPNPNHHPPPQKNIYNTQTKKLTQCYNSMLCHWKHLPYWNTWYCQLIPYQIYTCLSYRHPHEAWWSLESGGGVSGPPLWATRRNPQ